MKDNAPNNDLLSSEEIRDITGGAINKKKQASILDAAKIYYWWENQLICNALNWFTGRGNRA